MFRYGNFVESSSSIMTEPSDLRFLGLSGRSLFHEQGFLGDDVVVAVVDTGVSNHPDLEGKILEGINTNSSYPVGSSYEDDDGHGTHVAGSIAGSLCGVAPNAKILPVKALGTDGGNWNDLINALIYIRDWVGDNGKRVDIVNMSLGAPESYALAFPNEFSQFYSLVQQLVSMGIVVICAAGNSGQDIIEYPAYFQEVVSVGAVDIDKKVAFFTTRNDEVDVCQVGVNVTSAWYLGGYKSFNGTSMATPLVAGLAALLISKYKSIFSNYMPEPVIYESLKLNTIDVGISGIDVSTGAGFCCLNPRPLNIEARLGSSVLNINEKNVALGRGTLRVRGDIYVPLKSLFESLGGTVMSDKDGKIKLRY